ncbi:Peptidase family S58 [Methylobrevis pamukkalensis]|uniref:Peptidase family S58 n=1 Tax=Methylobrevis pamukkalensis TaxID=1439726 RepID=A0A1E3H3D2_9HYPH|nr:Peptidase family S58 [Methylobrevis pamukkalensis]
MPDDIAAIITKLSRNPVAGVAGANTTIAVVATDAILTKAEARRLAVAAHDGLARAIWPAHTPLDGDLVFALSTGRRPLAAPTGDFLDICAAAAATLSRAVARGVYATLHAE